MLTIAQYVNKYNLRPLKKYGQNFIYDQTLCDKIVRYAAPAPDVDIVEIGPGPGGLTRSILAAKPKSLKVIEMDTRFLDLLKEIQGHHPNLSIIHGNALNHQLADLTSNKVQIIANLPYNVGCKLLVNWLHQLHLVESITVMLQKEVVDRITAKPNSKSYGRLSILCQTMCKTEKCFDVSSHAFYPRPKVESAIVKLTPKSPQISYEILHKLEQVTLVAFNNRRKTLKSALKKEPEILKVMDKLGIASNLRAENLTPEDYLRIARS